MESKDINEFTDCEYFNRNGKGINYGICDRATVYENNGNPITKCSDVTNCFIKNLYKVSRENKQQYEELRQLHNSCCEEFKQEIDLRIDAYNKLSRDFFNSKYCDTEHCKLLQEKQQECEKLKFTIKHTGLLDLMNNNVLYKNTFDEIMDLCLNAYCLTNGTNKDMSIFTKKILDILQNLKQSLNKIGE